MLPCYSVSAFLPALDVSLRVVVSIGWVHLIASLIMRLHKILVPRENRKDNCTDDFFFFLHIHDIGIVCRFCVYWSKTENLAANRAIAET